MNKTKVKGLFRVFLYQINKTPEETFSSGLISNSESIMMHFQTDYCKAPRRSHFSKVVLGDYHFQLCLHPS
jgi:hypothetical protein